MAEPLSKNPAAIEAAEGLSFKALGRRAARFYEQGYFDAAHQLALELVKTDPDHIDTLLILAHALREMGHFDEALSILQRIVKLQPGHVQARAAMALTLFYKEDWQQAWTAFDIRMKLMDEPPQVSVPGPDGKPVPLTPWRGGPVSSSLLILGEQGLGDTIQFARFLPLLAKAGAKIICVVQPRLFKLLKTLDAEVEFRPSGRGGSVSGIKGWTPLMQLPQALGLKPENFAPQIPYLRAEPERAARWREKIGTHGFKIGIAWQGNPDPRIDAGRSAPLAAFAPLADIPGVRLISLQAGKAAGQAAQAPFAVETLGEDFDAGEDGFLDSAAAMQSLDLVISVDSSLAHLAGALGRPVFILLKRPGSDWRWLYAREETFWYPSAKLLRQKTPGGWAELLSRAADKVRELVCPSAPIAIGELYDKLSILEIKRQRIADPAKRANVEREYEALSAIYTRHDRKGSEMDKLLAELKQVNEELWEIEDRLRELEGLSRFDASFIELARAVYKTNDRRAALKRKLNALCGSALVEEKVYKNY